MPLTDSQKLDAIYAKVMGTGPAAGPSDVFPFVPANAPTKNPFPALVEETAAYEFLCSGIDAKVPIGGTLKTASSMYPTAAIFHDTFVYQGATKEEILRLHLLCLGLLGLPKDPTTNGSIREQAYTGSHHQAVEGAILSKLSHVGSPDPVLNQISAVIPGGGPIPPYPGDTDSIAAAKRGGLVINGPNGKPLYERTTGVPIKY